MNFEQKRKLYEQINMLEGLLAYAVQHDEVVEATRIREELTRLVGEVERAKAQGECALPTLEGFRGLNQADIVSHF